MLFHLFYVSKGSIDLYSHYNLGEEKPLPPPPNYRSVQGFYYACAKKMIELENAGSYDGFIPPT